MISLPPLATNCASAAFAAGLNSVVGTWISATVSYRESVSGVIWLSGTSLNENLSNDSSGRPLTSDVVGITPCDPWAGTGPAAGIRPTFVLLGMGVAAIADGTNIATTVTAVAVETKRRTTTNRPTRPGDTRRMLKGAGPGLASVKNSAELPRQLFMVNPLAYLLGPERCLCPTLVIQLQPLGP